jgi:hypothetical protein
MIVYLLQNSSIDIFDPSNCEAEVFNPNTGAIEVYLPGPPGAAGPPGINSAKTFAVVTSSGNIPLNQNYTIVNATAPTTQVLPLISGVIIGNLTGSFIVTNVTAHTVEIIASGSDEILVGSPVLEPFINSSFTFVATPLGWIIV